MVNEHYASYNSQITVSNGTTHLHSVSTRGASPPKATLVQIDSPSLATTLPVCGGYTMGQPTTTENTRGLQIFRRNPILRSILKNGKVHNSSTEEGLLPTVAQPRSGILKKVASSEQNGGPFVMHTPVKFPLGPTPVVPAVTVSAKSAASIVQFRIDSASSSASGRSNEQSVSSQGP